MTQLAFSADHAGSAARDMLACGPWANASADGRFGPAGGLRAIGPVLFFAQDRDIYGEGDDADVFFKVVSGVVRTCKFLSDGRRQIDSFHVAGDVFGLEAGAEHSLSAEAVCDCTVMSYRLVASRSSRRMTKVCRASFSHTRCEAWRGPKSTRCCSDVEARLKRSRRSSSNGPSMLRKARSSPLR